jgi:hypothetical protein
MRVCVCLGTDNATRRDATSRGIDRTDGGRSVGFVRSSRRSSSGTRSRGRAVRCGAVRNEPHRVRSLRT